jgi:hypothetical protein
MRLLKSVLVTIALLAGAAIVAPPASAAEAYGAGFTMFFYGENWPCNSTCTNTWDYSWAKSNFIGVSGGPSWSDSFNFATVSITYTSVNCTTDDWDVTIDSHGASEGGSNLGVLYMSLHRVGTVFTGSAYFASDWGVGDGYYSMAGTVTPGTGVDTVNACLGGPKALNSFSWDGAMELVNV